MRHDDIVKDTHFIEVTEVKTDSKNRITLSKKGWKVKAKIFKVYLNEMGQIILDPQVTIPAYEQWLFQNKEAKKRVEKGLNEAKKGQLVDADEDFSKYVNEK